MQNNPQNNSKIIAQLVLARARYVEQFEAHPPNCHCLAQISSKIQYFIARSRTIEFVLPAFPAKSPNRLKTVSPLPDLGEELALTELNQLCTQINKIYSAGSKITICSDGRVFNDLLSVSDNDVTDYQAEIKTIIKKKSLLNLFTYNMEKHYQSDKFIKTRQLLLDEFGESTENLKNKIQNLPENKNIFNGIHRFVYEDLLSINKDFSKNKLRHYAKLLTYLVIQRSDAWSNLIKANFPKAIRLSIHPQICGSDKIGIMLLKSNNCWATPWHRVTLQTDKNDYELITRSQAELLQAKPVFKNTKFSHYTL